MAMFQLTANAHDDREMARNATSSNRSQFIGEILFIIAILMFAGAMTTLRLILTIPALH